MGIKKYSSFLICLILLILTACEPADNSSIGLPPVSDVQADGTNYPLPAENRRGYDATFESCPSSSTNGYYRASTTSHTLWYYDADAGKGFFLCAQSGCSHNDETCQAWIGKADSFTEYHGDILAVRQLEDGTVEFIKKTLADGKITVIDRWESGDKEAYFATIFRVAYNSAVIYVRKDFISDRGDTIDDKAIAFCWKYDLNTGEKTQMYPKEEARFLLVLAFSEKYALVRYAPENKETAGRELRLYDMDTFEYTVIGNTVKSGWVPSVNNAVYGDKAVYQIDETVYLLDITTGKSKEFITVENLLGCNLYDHKVFMTVMPSPEEYYFYYADIEDNNTLTKYNNLGHTDVMQFSIFSEGESFFFSTGLQYLSKEDFYSENYPEHGRVD